jgi:hypothetical protein
MNPISNEPVLAAVLASVITWIAAKYAVKVDPQQASEAAGVVLLIGGVFARQLVRPVAKDEEPLIAEEIAHARKLLELKAEQSAAKEQKPPPSRIADERPQPPPRRPMG